MKLYGNPMTGLPMIRKSSDSKKFISNDIKKRKSETISEMLPSVLTSYYINAYVFFDLHLKRLVKSSHHLL